MHHPAATISLFIQLVYVLVVTFMLYTKVMVIIYPQLCQKGLLYLSFTFLSNILLSMLPHILTLFVVHFIVPDILHVILLVE